MQHEAGHFIRSKQMVILHKTLYLRNHHAWADAAVLIAEISFMPPNQLCVSSNSDLAQSCSLSPQMGECCNMLEQPIGYKCTTERLPPRHLKRVAGWTTR